ncbi:hypothetical protein AGMMS50256_29230 [Betaproteobacteria bacterium]|nr:hypothetical protein AGMMS50256_29230 [Betaproteobacteria bacterium]
MNRLNALTEALFASAVFFLVGASIGVAQLVSGSGPVTWRLAFARAITVGGLSVAAGAILIWIPDAPVLGQVGLSAALASLGTSGLERLFFRIMKRKGEE